jgi:glycosyltransferase involved in cell wall biosynthesis
LKNLKIQVLRVVIGLNQGGVQQAVLNLAKNLDSTKFELIVCAIENGGLIANEIKETGIKVIVLGYKRQPLKTILALVKIIKKHSIDIVHASSYHPSLYGRIAALIAQTPVIMSYEHVIFDHFRPLRALINRILNFFTDGYTAVSKGVSKQVTQWYGYNKEKVHVVYNGVDIIKFSPKTSKVFAKKKLKINPKSLVIGMICRLDLNKGHKYFFEAISKLRKKQKYDIQFVIIGTGPAENAIIDLAKAHGLEKSIMFLGIRRDINVCMNAIDIFCFPTLQEGFSNVLLEAMSSGCAIVASNFSSNLEILKHEKNSLIVQMRNAEELSQAIQRFIDSESLRVKMGSNARATIEKSFSVNAYSKNMAYIYEKLWRNVNALKSKN